MAEVVETAIYKLAVQNLSDIDKADQLLAKLAVSEERVTQGTRATTDALGNMIARLDQRTRAENELIRSLERISRFENEGIGTAQQRAQATTLVTQRYNEQIAVLGKAGTAHNDNSRAINDNTKATETSTRSFALNSQGLRELQASGVNAFQALASGMAPWRVAQTEGAQVMGAFVQGGLGVSGVLRALISPIGLAVGAFTGLGVGLFVLLERASSNEAQLRRFDAALRGVGPTSQVTSVGLQRVTYDLRALGVAADDAEKAMLAIANNPALNRANPAAAATIANIGVNVGSRLGITGAEGIAKVNEAVKEGAPALAALGLLTRAFTADEAAAINIDAARGNGLRALNDAIKLLDENLRGEHGKVISATQRATESLTGAWNNLFNKMSESSAVKTVNDGLIQMTNNLAKLISTGNITNLPKGNILGWFISGGLVGAAVRGIANLPGGSPEQAQQDMRDALAVRAAKDAGGAAMIPGGALGGGASASGSFATLTSISTANAQITRLIPEFANRLDAWVADLSDADRAVVRITSGYATGGHAPDSNHYRGTAVDIRGLTPSAAASLGRFGLAQNVPGDWPHVEPIEIPSAAAASAAARAAASRAFAVSSGGMASGLTRPGSLSPAATADEAAVAAKTATAQGAQTESLDKLNRARDDAVRLAGELGIKQQADAAFTAKYNEVLDRTKDSTDAWSQANIVFNETMDKATAAAAAAAAEEDKKTGGILKSVDAFKISEAEGYRAIAAEEARIKVLERGGDAATEQRLALEASAAAAIQAGQKQVAAANPQLIAAEKLAEAAKGGAAAEHEQQLVNEAGTRTQDALAKAEASRNPTLIAQAKALNDAALAEIRRSDAAKNALAIQQSINQRADQTQILQLQAGMLGQTPEAIAAATATLQEQIRLRDLGSSISKETAAADLASVDALNKVNIAVAEQNRNWQRVEETVRSIADQIATTLTSAIAGLFDKSKATDWMATIKSGLQSIGQQLVSGTLIKPLIGSVLGGLGFGNAAQSFGNLFGSSSSGGGGLLTGLFGGSSNTSNVTLVKNADGSISIKDIAGNAKGLFDAFSGSDSSSGGGLFGNLFGGGGNSAGFLGINNTLATDASFAGFGAVQQGSSVGFAGGGELGLGLGEGLTSTPAEGLLSGLGGALGGLGSVIPFVGPVLGIASMFLGSLFGNKKPPNLVSTGGIDLSAGGTTVANPFSSGNAQNDQTAKQITDAISTFTKNILKETGGAISGNIDVQAGSRDGIKIGGTIGSVATGLVGVMKFADAQSAVAATSLAIAQHLEGVSDTMKKVLAQLTDATQIEDAIKFVQVYDNLKDAADSAFTSISTDTKTIGPFAKAMDDINTLFRDLTDKANGFGLSLDPLIAGLAEATKRLQEDFTVALNQAFNQVSGSDFINQLNAARKDFTTNTAEAQAIGLGADQATLDKISSVYNFQIYNVLKGLSKVQLESVANDVTDAFATANPEIASLARNMEDMSFAANLALKATGDASVAFAQFAGGLQALKDLVTSLTTGQLSGATIAQQVQAANDNFNRELGLVQGGNLNELGNLAAAGGNAVTLSQQAYGNAPQTASLRTQILTGVDQVLASRSFASGTDYTPPGWIMVGEKGPELMHQSGGAAIVPFNHAGGASNTEVVALLREVIARLDGGNRIAQAGFVETVGHLGAIKTNTKQPVTLSEPLRRRA